MLATELHGKHREILPRNVQIAAEWPTYYTRVARCDGVRSTTDLFPCIFLPIQELQLLVFLRSYLPEYANAVKYCARYIILNI